MNGSVLPTLSVLSQATTFMMTLANDNLVAPFSWVMGRSRPLSLLPVLTLQDWDAGSGLPYLAGQELLHVLLVLTAPAIPPVSKPTVSGHSTAPTSSVRTTCPPRLAFFHDLGLAISTWQADGDNIILMADMNGDIRKAEISSFAINLGLQESILAAHPTLLPPITFKRGNREGKSPIDGVWMSATLHASAVSLCPFSLSPAGDH